MSEGWREHHAHRQALAVAGLDQGMALLVRRPNPTARDGWASLVYCRDRRVTGGIWGGAPPIRRDRAWYHNSTVPQPPKPTIREVLLAEIEAVRPKTQFGAPLYQKTVLEAAAGKLGARQDQNLQQAILTEWGELFRTGLVAWGLNLSNPDPPFFHLTDRGRQALKNWTRDPSNPDGYLRHLDSITKLDVVALSYLTEGLYCYAAGFFKAAAVMVGAAAERIVLDLRDVTVDKLTSLGKVPVPRGLELEEWKVKTVSDALRRFFDSHKGNKQGQMGLELSEAFDGYWPAFTLQIRAARNDAGHPTSVEPVTSDTVHASLLVFPELARLADRLTRWAADSLA